MAVLGLHCCTGLSLVAVCGLLTAVASLVAEHGLLGTQPPVVATHGFSRCVWRNPCTEEPGGL